MKRHLVIMVLAFLLLTGGIGIVSATINITPSEVSTNYIKWTWPYIANLTGINIDGKLIPTYDPNGDSYILSNLNPSEIHQITVYAAGDLGVNATTTLPEATGDVPLGIWIYGIPAILVLIAARAARIALLNVICVIFGLFGLYNLITVKTVMDSGMWTLALIIYTLLIVIGMLAWAYQTGRVFK